MTNLEKYLYQLRRIEEHREATAEKEIRKLYKKLLKELSSYLADIYTRYSEDDKLTYSSLVMAGMDARFLEEVEQQINSISPQVASQIQDTVTQTYKACYDGMVDSVKKAADNREALQKAFVTVTAVSPDVIRAAVNNPVSGLTLKDTLEKHRKEIIYDIKKNIGVGLVNGDRYSSMARRISESLDGDYKKAIRIARTETHRVRESGFNDAATALNETLKQGKSGYVMAKTWNTMDDSRVRPQGQKRKTYNHVKMNGVTIPQDELFVLPSGATCMCPSQTGVAGEDINCRCYLSYDLVLISELTGNKDKATGKDENGNYTTTKDAFDKVSLTGIDSEFKKEIENELLMLANNYPIGTTDITVKTNKASGEFGHATAGIRGSRRKDGYYAVADIHIAYNQTLQKTSEISQKYHEMTYSRRGSKLANSANAHKATISHEYAHQIDNYYLFKKKPELLESIMQFKEPKKITTVAEANAINALNREIHSDNGKLSRVIFQRMSKKLDVDESEMFNQIRSEYGTYAASNTGEFLAEAFANMLNLEEKDKTDFMKLFEETFNEEFDKVLRG